MAECALAEELGVAPPGLRERVAALLRRLGLPARLADPVDADRVVEAMATDKKNRGARVHFALPQARWGQWHQGSGWTTAVAPRRRSVEALSGDGLTMPARHQSFQPTIAATSYTEAGQLTRLAIMSKSG